jgi:hypothetical protein
METQEPRRPTRVDELYEDEVELPTPEPAPDATDPPPSPLEAKAEQEEPEEDGAIPKWARPYIPDDLRIPRGKQVSFVRFKSKWTDASDKGVPTEFPYITGSGEARKLATREELTRVVICWPISDAEEKHALKRTRGEQGRVIDEYAKQMIRVVDGMRVDWTGEYAKRDNVGQLVGADIVWKELGPKCCRLLKNLYVKTHNLSDEELADFFVNCLVVTSAVAG